MHYLKIFVAMVLSIVVVITALTGCCLLETLTMDDETDRPVVDADKCACCGDCCGMLNSLKMQAKPASSVKSNYFAQIDGEECTGCEICLERCQMEAITIEDDIAVLDRDRCIGCGLCVTTCPSEAASLVKKSDDQLYEPPENHVDMYMKMGMERGLI